MSPEEEIKRYAQDYAQHWPKLMQDPRFRNAVEQRNAVIVGVGELAVELVQGNLVSKKQIAAHKLDREVKNLFAELNQAMFAKIREFMSIRPFKAFTFSLDDSRRITIREANEIAILPGCDFVQLTMANGNTERIEIEKILNCEPEA